MSSPEEGRDCNNETHTIKPILATTLITSDHLSIGLLVPDQTGPAPWPCIGRGHLQGGGAVGRGLVRGSEGEGGLRYIGTRRVYECNSCHARVVGMCGWPYALTSYL